MEASKALATSRTRSAKVRHRSWGSTPWSRIRSRPDPGSDVALNSFDGQSTTRRPFRSEEHTSELQSLMRISCAVFCMKKKKYRLQLEQKDLMKENKKNNNKIRK